MSFRRLSGWAGIGAFLAFVVGSFMVPQAPAIGDSSTTAAKISDFYVENHTGLWTASIILGIGLSLVIVWAAGLWEITGRPERERGDAWAVVGLVGLGGVVVVSLLTVAMNDALALLDGLPGDPGSLLAVFGIVNAIAALTGVLALPTLVGFSIAGYRVGLIPPWLAALGLVGAVLGLAGTPAAFVTGTTLWGYVAFAGFLVALVWILVTAILMTRQVRAAPD